MGFAAEQTRSPLFPRNVTAVCRAQRTSWGQGLSVLELPPRLCAGVFGEGNHIPESKGLDLLMEVVCFPEQKGGE